MQSVLAPPRSLPAVDVNVPPLSLLQTTEELDSVAQMDYLSRKTRAWQSCDYDAERDSPRTCELKLLRARRVAYYESTGILKTSSPGNDNKSSLKDSPRAPLGFKTNLSKSQTSPWRGRQKLPYSAVSEDVNTCQQFPKVSGDKNKDTEMVGQQVQSEGRRNSCPSELDLSLLDNVLVPETQKLRHVINWAQRFLTKCHEGQELKNPQENPPFTSSLLNQSKKIQDCCQDTSVSSCRPPSQSRNDHSWIHTNSQNSVSFSSVPTRNLSRPCFSLDLLSSFEGTRIPGNQSSGSQEVLFQKEKRHPLSPVVGLRQPSLVQSTSARPENASSQHQSDPRETDNLSEIGSIQPQPKCSCEKSLFEKTNENWHENGYFWAPLTDSSEDEDIDEYEENWRTFTKGIQLRDSKEISGISLSPRRSPMLKGNIFSRREADVNEKSKDATVRESRDFTSRIKADGPWDTRSSIHISKMSLNQFDSSVHEFGMRKGEPLTRELDFVVSLTDLSYKSGLLPECGKESEKTFIGQTVRGSQEVSVNSGFDVDKSKISERGQRQINEMCQGNDSVIQISKPQLNSLEDTSENVTFKGCSDCASESELTSGHHCVMCHNIRVELPSSTGIDWNITKTPEVIAKEMLCESKEKFFSSYPVSTDLLETMSEDSSLYGQAGGGGGGDGCSFSCDDALSEKSEQRASVLETYFFYLHHLNKIRGYNSEEGPSSFPNHWTGFLENKVRKGDPEKKDIGEVSSNDKSSIFQAGDHRETAEPGQKNTEPDPVEEETTEEQLFPKSLSNLIKESKLCPKERSFSASIKVTSKATGYKNFCEKSSMAWSSHKHEERELRSQNMSRPSSAKAEKRKSTESSQSICPSDYRVEEINVYPAQTSMCPLFTKDQQEPIQYQNSTGPCGKICTGSTPKYLCKNVYIDLERQMANKKHQGNSVLSMWQLLPDEIWIFIFSFLSHKELSCIAQVCRHFYQLASDDSFWKRIHVSDCHSLNDNWLVTLGRHHPQSLTLRRCHDDIQAITDQGLKQFFHHCRESLEELNVTSCSGPRLKGDKLLLYASTFCNRLTVVDISWSGATDLGVLALAEGASSLLGLSINGCQITDKAIRALVKKHGNSLNKLEVFGCHALTARCVGCLAQSCPNLQTLNIGRVPKITDACFAKILRNLKKVTTLNVTGLEMVRDRIVHLVVTHFSNLDCLVLSSCSRVTDVSLLEISTYLRTIRYLDVSGCKKVTDFGIHALARGCHQLHYLDLSSTGTSRRGVCLLASYCHGTLECLKLSFCKEITLDAIKKLCKNCTRLKMLHLYGCHITPDLSSIKDIYKRVEVFHDGSASTC
uniref:F-box domain-containing protein n=2 Tax=Sarcophilus harrisii TaxID=9305 RepID=A0A7N4V588_SARHA